MSELVGAPPHAGVPAPVQGGPRRRSRRRRTILAAGLGAAAVVTAVALGVARRPAPAPPPASDLPRHVGDALEVSPAFRDRAGIATTPAVRAPITPLVSVVGQATFDPTRVAAVGTRAPGIVTKVFFVEGDTVAKGALLAEIESPGLADAQAEKHIAEAKKHAATLNAARERGLLARNLTTAREAEQAAVALEEQTALEVAARQRVEALGGHGKVGVSELRAPVGGLIAERSIAPGQSVGPGHVAFRVGDLDELWVLLRVFERDVTLLRAGDPVEVRPVARPDQIIRGKVALVGAVIDAMTRTADVRVEVPNEGRVLRPGEGVKALIRASGPARVTLSVPASAVTTVDGAPTVFVAETPTRFAARKVELGLQGGDLVEIVAGVREGEAVVSRSVLALKSELFR